MPAAGSGLDLAQRYDDGVDSWDMCCGHTSQTVAVHRALMPAWPAALPDRQDRVTRFAADPGAQIAPVPLAALVPDASLPPLDESSRIFGSIGMRPMQLDESPDISGPCDRPTWLRGCGIRTVDKGDIE